MESAVIPVPMMAIFGVSMDLRVFYFRRENMNLNENNNFWDQSVVIDLKGKLLEWIKIEQNFICQYIKLH